MRLRYSLGQSWECEKVFLKIFHILLQSEKTIPSDIHRVTYFKYILE